MTDRRQIEELVLRYELEPMLSDVYVEGATDQLLIEWLAAQSDMPDVIAYEIDTVDVPASVLTAYGLTSGNRSRLIAFARELERLSSVELYNTVACVIDGDLDHFTGRVPHHRLLIVTDVTSAEAYLFNESAIDKFCRFVISRKGVDPRQVMSDILPALRELFMVRVAATSLGVGLALVSFERSCRVRTGLPELDREDYIGRFVRRDGYASRYDELLAEVARLHELPYADARHVIHGHDLVEVLRWYARCVLRVSSVPPVDQCARALRACVDFHYFSGSTLLRELQLRFGRGPDGASDAIPAPIE